MIKIQKFSTCILWGILLSSHYINAQSPNKMSYQAVVRNSNDQLVVNKAIGVKISVLQFTVNGAVVYSETQVPISNVNGLISIDIGAGETIDNFASIEWQNGPYFIKTEIDPLGGNNYSISGTSQLLSVPYALHASTVESITELDPIYNRSVASAIIESDTSYWNNKLDDYTESQNLTQVLSIDNLANSQIKNLLDPTEEQDAATKIYVDNVKKLLFKLFTLDELFNVGVTVDDLLGLGVSIYGMTGVVSDFEGSNYNWVAIGNQIWMAENLRSTKYNDGETIPLITENETWRLSNTPAYSWFDNDSISNSSRGALYNFYVVSELKLCPKGWHVPSDNEWTVLQEFLAEQGNVNTEGTVLKSTSGWYNESNGTDDYGFSAYPSGYRYFWDGSSRSIEQIAVWWSSSDAGNNDAYGRSLNSTFGTIERLPYNSQNSGYSVRCIKD